MFLSRHSYSWCVEYIVYFMFFLRLLVYVVKSNISNLPLHVIIIRFRLLLKLTSSFVFLQVSEFTVFRLLGILDNPLGYSTTENICLSLLTKKDFTVWNALLFMPVMVFLWVMKLYSIIFTTTVFFSSEFIDIFNIRLWIRSSV